VAAWSALGDMDATAANVIVWSQIVSEFAQSTPR
jgi:hypothetical protein